MKKHAIYSLGLALMLGAVTVPGVACDAGAAPITAQSPILGDALQRLKQEQLASLQQQSRIRLAELRSEAASAIAQGAVSGDAATIKAAP